MFRGFQNIGSNNQLFNGFVSNNVDARSRPFSPLNYNLLCWYDFNDTATVTYDVGISKVLDLSSNAYHLLQSTNTNKPSYVLEGGYHVARFDGNDNYMQVDFGTYRAQPIVYFVVHRLVGAGITADAQQIIDGITLTDRHTLYVFNGATNKGSYIYAGSPLYSGDTTVWPVPTRILTGCFNGIYSQILINGSLKATGDVGTSQITGLNVGRHISAYRYIKGDINEIIGVFGVLTNDDINQFHTYFANKYGISISLL